MARRPNSPGEGSMTLVLTNEDAAQVLTMKDTIATLELLYGDLGRGSAVYRGRTDLFTPTTGASDDVPSAYQLKTLDGAVPRWKGCGSGSRRTSSPSRWWVGSGGASRCRLPRA